LNQPPGENAEQQLIRRLSSWLVAGQQESGIFGVGDDCALLPAALGSELTVLTTDLLVESTHFLHNANTNWHGVGAKAATANISDIASMGARPISMLVGIGIPLNFPMVNLEAIYAGLSSIASRFNTSIVGGDTTRADHVTIAITVTGLKDPATAACRRSNARAGDQLYVTGTLGGSRAGLDAILASSECPESPSQLSKLHYYRLPRVEVGMAIAQSFNRVAMIDISDSIFNEARLLGEASGVELELHLEKIPVHPQAVEACLEIAVDPARYVLFSGEEYELLFALPVAPEELRKHLTEAGVNCPVTHVGTVNSGSGLRLLQDGHPVDPTDETFVHFP